SVLVVGAGIVGAACAEAFAQAGAEVRIVDAGIPGGGATAAGMGHVLVLEDSDAQLALTRLGRELWHERRADWPATVEDERCGTIWIAADDAELDAAAGKQAALAAQGIAARILDGAALRSLEPQLRDGLAGGLLIPD